jgi:hypothetical protein
MRLQKYHEELMITVKMLPATDYFRTFTLTDPVGRNADEAVTIFAILQNITENVG